MVAPIPGLLSPFFINAPMKFGRLAGGNGTISDVDNCEVRAHLRAQLPDLVGFL